MISSVDCFMRSQCWFQLLYFWNDVVVAEAFRDKNDKIIFVQLKNVSCEEVLEQGWGIYLLINTCQMLCKKSRVGHKKCLIFFRMKNVTMYRTHNVFYLKNKERKLWDRAIQTSLDLLSKSTVLKLSVTTLWCLVLIFQGRRTNINSMQFYLMS